MTDRSVSSRNHAVRAEARDRRWAASGSLGVIVAGLLAILALALPGCSQGVANPVDPDRAMNAMKTALDAWKQGQDPQSLQGASTPMVIQDLDWQAGAKLVDYQVLGDGEPADANLRVSVKLTLAGKGKQVEKTAHYLVTTSPSVTVFRDMMRR